MADSDSDEDLKRAIALSLESVSKENKNLKKNKPPAETNVISLVSDSEDDDDDLDAPLFVKPAPRISSSTNNASKARSTSKSDAFNALKKMNDQPNKQNSSTSSTPRMDVKKEASPIPETKPKQDPEPLKSGLLMLDRKKMEEERLARVNQKRKREEESSGISNESRKRVATGSPAPANEQSKEQNLAGLLAAQGIRRKTLTSIKNSQESEKSKITDKGGESVYKSAQPWKPLEAKVNDPKVISYREQQKTTGGSGIQFPDGVVKKTWALGHPRTGDDIKIEEVFQKNTLELAVLSAFVLDPQWVNTKLEDKTNIVWVVQAKSEEEKQKCQAEASKNMRFCFPSMEGQINCMHSKLQLLAHPTHLRIVVPSANLVAYDWGETGTMENICFLIDIPRLPEGQTTDESDLTDFGKELIYFLTAMGMHERLIASMLKFDYSRTAGLAFVHTIGGPHTGRSWRRTGYPGLGTAIQKLGLSTYDALEIDFLAASIGSLNESFIQALYLAAQGNDGLTEYGWRVNKIARSKEVTETERKLSDGLKSRCRIYFPTRDTVAASKGGTDHGGTICLQSKWFDSPTFPRQLMRDCKSQRQGLLMHNKMWFVRPHEKDVQAWAYLGSANLSEAAWGRLSKDKVTKEPKLNCRNWECGVVFPISRASSSTGLGLQSSSRSGDAKKDMAIFQGSVPVPMVVPGQEYGVRRPWFNNES